MKSPWKSSYSQWIKTKGGHYRDFFWQSGYEGFSVSRSSLEGVKKIYFSSKRTS